MLRGQLERLRYRDRVGHHVLCRIPRSIGQQHQVSFVSPFQAGKWSTLDSYLNAMSKIRYCSPLPFLWIIVGGLYP